MPPHVFFVLVCPFFRVNPDPGTAKCIFFKKVEDCFGAARTLRSLTKALLADLEAAAAADSRAGAAPTAAPRSPSSNGSHGSNGDRSSGLLDAGGPGVHPPSIGGGLLPTPPPAGVGPVFLRHCNLKSFLEGYVTYTRGYKEGRHKLARLQRKYW